MMSSEIAVDLLDIDQRSFSSYVKSKLKDYFNETTFFRYFFSCEYFACDGALKIVTPSIQSSNAIARNYFSELSRFSKLLWGDEIKVLLECCSQDNKNFHFTNNLSDGNSSNSVLSGTLLNNDICAPIANSSRNVLNSSNASNICTFNFPANTSNQSSDSFYERGSHDQTNVVYSNFNDSPYRLENFIVDSSNEIAFSLANTLIKNAHERQNLGEVIFICGEVGVGKTHIGKAVDNYFKKHGGRSVYFSAEGFTGAFISALRNKSMHDFKKSITQNSVLIIDDLHCLLGRTKTLEELSSIVSLMLDEEKSVVMLSTEQPRVFDSKLRSRILSGSFAKIESPGVSLKNQIANAFVAQKNLSLSTDVIEFLSSNITGGIRELKGALNRLNSASKFRTSAIDIDAMVDIIRDLLPETLTSKKTVPLQERDASASAIIKATCVFFGLDALDLYSTRKCTSVVNARGIAMYLVRNNLGYTFETISTLFHRGSHQSVLRVIKSIERRILEKDSDLLRNIESVKRIIVASKN